MSTKDRITSEDIQITPDDSIREMLSKGGIKVGLRRGERAAAQDAEKAKQPRKPGGLDFLGTLR